ncbi:MAG: hypothetical protein WCP28_04895 [Actinomycetes bacterium]
MRSHTTLVKGARVLTWTGIARVAFVSPFGVELLDCHGDEFSVAWPEVGEVRRINGTKIDNVHAPMKPWWDQLSESARQDALTKLEVVQEILTGYRDGHPAFARNDEPRWAPLDEDSGSSIHARSQVMAEQLEQEWASDRVRQREIVEGGAPRKKTGLSSIKRWVNAYLDEGFPGLVDERYRTPGQQFAAMDEAWKDALDAELNGLNGDKSTPNNGEIIRRAHVRLIDAGTKDVDTPQRLTGRYVAWRRAAQGGTTRAQASTASRKVSGHKHFPALRLGQVVAIDVTRADNLVWDVAHERPMSVEIISAIDVLSKVVLALRVIAMSADAVDAGLIIYDILRPFHMVVDGTSIGDWRWAGLPRGLALSAWTLKPRPGRGISIKGLHEIPALSPTAISTDNGSIFLSAFIRALLRFLMIDLLVNRKGQPTDNPNIERWHETLQRGLQQLGGYKGRYVAERGRFVAKEPLVTAAELQAHLHRFIALDYHRTQHTGLILPTTPDIRLSPLDMFDISLEAVGAIDVPTRPDLMYDFLPTRWGTLRHAGVEFNNLVYDARVLKDFRLAPKGTFQLDGQQTPFIWDPHDISRIWFRHPDLGTIHEIPWRGADLLQAPMTQKTAEVAIRRVRERGGNAALTGKTGRNEILAQINELTPSPKLRKEDRRLVAAATLRVAQSQTDHGEAQEAIHASADGTPHAPEPLTPDAEPADFSIWDDHWPAFERGA